MINLQLGIKPNELTDDLQKELTLKFINDESDVWHIDFLRVAVVNMSFGKCCYSEIFLNQKSTYLEIEHFYHKNKYKDKVLQWGNLIASCKKCNVSKNNFDNFIEPIIYPFLDIPRKHIYFAKARLYPKTEIGKRTIDVLSLNDRDHFVNPRFMQADQIIEGINDFYASFIENDELLNISNTRKRNQLNKYKSLLQFGTRKKEFSAYISTEILDNLFYSTIKQFLIGNSFWDIEFQEINEELIFCYLGEQEINVVV